MMEDRSARKGRCPTMMAQVSLCRGKGVLNTVFVVMMRLCPLCMDIQGFVLKGVFFPPEVLRCCCCSLTVELCSFQTIGICKTFSAVG